MFLHWSLGHSLQLLPAPDGTLFFGLLLMQSPVGVLHKEDRQQTPLQAQPHSNLSTSLLKTS
jgi:hypothetical protein